MQHCLDIKRRPTKSRPKEQYYYNFIFTRWFTLSSNRANWNAFLVSINRRGSLAYMNILNKKCPQLQIYNIIVIIQLNDMCEWSVILFLSNRIKKYKFYYAIPDFIRNEVVLIIGNWMSNKAYGIVLINR